MAAPSQSRYFTLFIGRNGRNIQVIIIKLLNNHYSHLQSSDRVAKTVSPRGKWIWVLWRGNLIKYCATKGVALDQSSRHRDAQHRMAWCWALEHCVNGRQGHLFDLAWRLVSGGGGGCVLPLYLFCEPIYWRRSWASLTCMMDEKHAKGVATTTIFLRISRRFGWLRKVVVERRSRPTRKGQSMGSNSTQI